MSREVVQSRSFPRMGLVSSVLVTILFATALYPSNLHSQASQPVSSDLSVTQDNMTPTPGGHDYIHLFAETVSPSNGTVSYHINYPMPKGRGISYPEWYGYNSAGLYQLMFLMPQETLNWVPNPLNFNGNNPYVTYQETGIPLMQFNCQQNPNPNACSVWPCNYVSGFTFTDLGGVSHNMHFGAAAPVGGPPSPTWGGNNPCGNGYVYPGTDGEVSGEFTCPVADSTNPACSGLGAGTIALLEGSQCNSCNPSTNLQIGPYTITDKNGTTYFFGGGQYNNAAQVWVDTPYKIEDRNGNVICIGAGGYPCPAQPGTTDTLGRSLVSGYPPTIGGISYKAPTPPAGAPSSVTVNYQVVHQKAYSSAYNEVIQCPWVNGDFVGQISGSQPAWTGIGLPDNTQYQFFYGNYNPSDSTILNNFGLLNEVIFPGGGWIKYVWKIETSSANATSIQYYAGKGLTSGLTRSNACELQYSVPRLYSRQVSYDGVSVAQTQVFTYTTTWPSNWANGPTAQSTTVQTTDNVLNKTSQIIYTYIPGSGTEQKVQYYDWGNNTTPIKTVYKAWFNSFQEICELTTINGMTSGHFYQYMTQTNPPTGPYTSDYLTDDQEFDYGLISNPTVCGTQTTAGVAPSRETKTTYQMIQVPNSVVPTVQNYGSDGAAFYRPSTVVTYAGSASSGARIAETDYAYDGGTLTSPSTVVQHDDLNYSSGTTARGNATSITRQCFTANCTSASPQTTFAYDTTGQLVSKTAPCGNVTGGCGDLNTSNQTTQYFYTDSPSNANAAGPSNAYLTKVISPPTGTTTHQVSFSYNYGLGDLVSSTDENNQTTTYSYECSSAPCSALDRLTQSVFPDSGKTTITYNDWTSITTNQWITTSGNPKTNTVVMDKMFRTVQTQLSSDPEGTDYTDTTLDAEGRAVTVWNPHRTGSSPTDGNVQTIADVLGRPLKITKQDGSVVSTLYNDPCFLVPNAYGVTVTDEAGNHRRSCTDGLGRLVEVDEPGAGAPPPSPATGTVYPSGGPQSPVTINPCSGNPPPGNNCPTTIYNSGTTYVTVNGYTASTGWSGNSNFTFQTFITNLASALNGTGQVTATVSGNNILLTSVQTGVGSNYSLSTSTTWDTQHFSTPSYSASLSGSSMTGGNGYLFYATAAFITLYNYDALGNLLCVEQHGNAQSQTGCSSPQSSDATSLYHVRRFTYDSLSRLISASNPESGTISYAYDANGNLSSKTAPQPNQLTQGVTETTNYHYDSLNRLLSKSYTGAGGPATATVNYGYDGISASGCTPPALSDSYPKPRRTSMCDGAGSSSWSHDKMGRIATEERTTAGVTRSTSYVYNGDGSVQSVTYPSGRTLNYGYFGTNGYSAGRLISVVDPSGASYVTAAQYAPPGEATSYKNGASITNTNIFGPRLQPLYLSASAASTIMQLCYDFHSAQAVSAGPCSFSATTAGDNGNIYQILNKRDSNRSQNFTYDALNRIQQGWSNGSSPLTTSWGETFTVDAWGNLTNKGPVGGKTNYENMNMAPANYKNQLNGLCHDAAGNLIYTPSNCPQTSFVPTYSYDAENRMVSNPGASYVYDGDGNRVKKVGSTTTLYWYGATGDILTETDASGGTVTDYVFFNGKRVARRDSTGTVHYYFSDHLGSTSLITDNVGTMSPHPQAESDFYPYGGEIPVTADTTNNHYKFTGKERDAETCGIYCLDNFGARYDASALGRFMTVDPKGGSTRRLDPQSWNRYSYTENNPLKFVDPDGMDIVLANDKDRAYIVNNLARLYATPKGRAYLERADQSRFTVTIGTGHLSRTDLTKAEPGTTVFGGSTRVEGGETKYHHGNVDGHKILSAQSPASPTADPIQVTIDKSQAAEIGKDPAVVFAHELGGHTAEVLNAAESNPNQFIDAVDEKSETASEAAERVGKLPKNPTPEDVQAVEKLLEPRKLSCKELQALGRLCTQ